MGTAPQLYASKYKYMNKQGFYNYVFLYETQLC